MDAIILSINGIRQIAAELREDASASVSFSWIGNATSSIFTVDVARCDDFGLHQWDPIRVELGDLISFKTSEVSEISDPTQSLTNAEQMERAKNQPRMIPNKSQPSPTVEKIGTLDCYINLNHVFSAKLSNFNMIAFNFLWIGDKSGMSNTYLGSEDLPHSEIPSICFGDEVTLRTMRK